MKLSDKEKRVLSAIGVKDRLSIQDLTRMEVASSRRTLQRYLGKLAENGLIERLGQTRASAYRITRRGREVLGSTGEKKMIYRFDPEFARVPILMEDPDEDKNVSDPDQEKFQSLRDSVRKPQHQREPVGYERRFLEDYEPNVTRYLGQELSGKLHRLGQSEHMASLPPGTYARQVLDRLLIDLSWNSSRLEGNTYSLLETDHLLRMGRMEEGGRIREAQMILNHKGAVEFLVGEPMELGYNRYTFLNLHAILVEGLLENPASEGRLREIPVGIGGTVYHPANTPAVVEKCFDLILEKVGQIHDPLEQAFFLMVHVPYLQPFEDGNKRLSRVSANLPLIQNNLSPLSFIDVPMREYVDGVLGVYELNRVELLRDVFARAYRKSAGRYASIRKEIGDPDPFWSRYREELKEKVRHVVVSKMGKLEAAEYLRQWSRKEVTASDQGRFAELVEGQLLLLNEGNIARMRLRPSEYEAWAAVWREN